MGGGQVVVVVVKESTLHSVAHGITIKKHAHSPNRMDTALHSEFLLDVVAAEAL